MIKQTDNYRNNSNNQVNRERNLNEIQEAITTIQLYLDQTKEVLDRIETFIVQLKSETPVLGEKSKHHSPDKTIKVMPGLR